MIEKKEHCRDGVPCQVFCFFFLNPLSTNAQERLEGVDASMIRIQSRCHILLGLPCFSEVAGREDGCGNGVASFHTLMTRETQAGH